MVQEANSSFLFGEINTMFCWWPGHVRNQGNSSDSNDLVILEYSSFSSTKLNTLRSRQNGRHLADNIFKCIFFNENVRISIKISLKFVPKDPVDNKFALVEVMAWHRTDDKPLPQPMMTQFNDAYIRCPA